MKRIFVVLFSAALTVILSLYFFLTPKQVISQINKAQQEVVLSAGRSEGNFLTGYRFSDAVLAGQDGARLYSFDQVMLEIQFMPLILGRIGIKAYSKEAEAVVSAGLGGSIQAEADFRGLPFDTATFSLPENVAFAAPLYGRMILSGGKADMEFRSDEIRWRRLAVSGFDLPLDMFKKGRGALSVEGDRIIIKSLAFEGKKGYARLSGGITKGQHRLTLELFPNDWDDLMLLPLKHYRVSPGQYKMPVDF